LEELDHAELFQEVQDLIGGEIIMEDVIGDTGVVTTDLGIDDGGIGAGGGDILTDLGTMLLSIGVVASH
jgi:hypothetical protein